MIEVINYTKTIKNSCVLNKVSVNFDYGTVYGLKGTNGAGKTMLMRAICGLITPTSGSVVIDGKILGKQISFPPSVGLLIERPSFIDSLTGIKNLKLISSISNIASDSDICEALTSVGLDPSDKRKYRKYSLGMKQRLGIAAAIMEKPKILILDEPLNALDSDGVDRVVNIVRRFKEHGSAVILTCHDEYELNRMSDVIINIKQGCIVND